MPVQLRADRQRPGQLARTITQLPATAATQLLHHLQALNRLDRADPHPLAVTRRSGSYVEVPVDAVTLVDVSVPGRPEHRCVPRRLTPLRVTGRVILKVRFGLHDPAG